MDIFYVFSYSGGHKYYFDFYNRGWVPSLTTECLTLRKTTADKVINRIAGAQLGNTFIEL